MTCATDFTDITGDGTKEYVYEVTDLTNVNVRACGASYPQAAGSGTAGILNEKVTAAPTVVPCFCMTANGKMAQTAEPKVDRKAGLSMAQQMITNALDTTPVNGKNARRGPGDGWPTLVAEWQAYIPESKIIYPDYSGDLSKPFVYFGGDGHGTWNPNESSRFVEKVTWNFGSAHSASYTKSMGTTHKYKCTVFAGSCVEIAAATAPTSQLGVVTGSGATWGSATLTASAKNPLVSIAPPIDIDVRVYVSDVTSYVRGYHDNMPKHEFYVGNLNADFYKIYESSYISAAQLPCLYSSPSAPIPGCGVFFNAQI